MKYSVGFLAVLVVAVCAFPACAAKARAQEQAAEAGQKSKSSKKSSSDKTQQPKPVATPAPCPTPTEATAGPVLEAVLSQMDAASAAFHTAEANVTQEDYQKVVEDLSIEEGRIYFRRSKGLQMAMDFTGSSDSKYVLLTDNKVRFYQPKIDQVTEHTLEKNSSETESMFALGFGGRGHDLLKSFDVKLGGSELIDGAKTSKLELTPKTAGLKKYFSRIELWIELPQDISLRQQFWQPSGDYHLACYSNIKINQSLPDDVFKLKTTSHTKTVRP
jgi:outer membrane lipoprotein-sorting protein